MSLKKPFHRNWRTVKPGPNAGFSGWGYIVDKDYAKSAAHYVRAYELIQSDLQRIFEYVEPSAESCATYSYRIHELLMRVCIEVEANFKAILSENMYTPEIDRFGNSVLNMRVYKKIETTHHLSSYEVILPIWNGARKVWQPFQGWNQGAGIEWYQAYNASKHDRQDAFKKANMETLISAVAGLLVLLSSQFGTQDFSSGASALLLSGYDYHEMDAAIGSLFRIKFPDDWSEDEIYDFDWSELRNENDRFSKIDYNVI